MTADGLATAVHRYAARFHAAALATGPVHHVASPLGGWLVLALAADGTDGDARRAAGAVLGLPVEDAAAAARVLLGDPHPAVAAAVACWSAPEHLGERLAGWGRGLPAEVETGPVPTQGDADRWAADRTGGLVDRFPVSVDRATVLVLASALASRVGWTQPLAAVGSAELGGPWAEDVGQVLAAREHDVHLVDTDAAGLVVAAPVESATGLRVVTVSAAPEVAPVDVLAAAHEVAADEHRRRSLFDVSLGPGHSWDLHEAVEEQSSFADRVEEGVALLPAWATSSTHPLLADDRFGFTTVTSHLLAALPHHPEGWEADAAQAAVATYGRVGFAAAAVTAVALRAGSATPPLRRVTRRTLTARFAHPHAVVAVADQREAGRQGPWDGLPVFSAWVAEPSEITD